MLLAAFMHIGSTPPLHKPYLGSEVQLHPAHLQDALTSQLAKATLPVAVQETAHADTDHIKSGSLLLPLTLAPRLFFPTGGCQGQTDTVWPLESVHVPFMFAIVLASWSAERWLLS